VDVSRRFPDLLDAGFTNDVRHDTGPYTTELVSKLSPAEQSDAYKFIVSVDGNGGTHGLYWALSSGSCVVNNAQYRQWFSSFFSPMVHYVPFSDAADTANLPETLQSAMANQKQSKNIGQNARGVAREIFNDAFVTRFMADTLRTIYRKQRGLL
jgi:hypothetical protein